MEQPETRRACRAVTPGARHLGDSVTRRGGLRRELQRVLEPPSALDLEGDQDRAPVRAECVRGVVYRQRTKPVERDSRQSREGPLQKRTADLPSALHVPRCADEVESLLADQPYHLR